MRSNKARRYKHRNTKARKRRRRMVRMLKGTAVFMLSLMVLASLSPFFITDAADLQAPEASYGVYSDIALLQEERYDTVISDRIRGESGELLEELYDDLGPRQDPPTPSINEVVTKIEPIEPRVPAIIDAVESTTILNRSTIFQTLLDQPLSYYIYTESGGNELFTKGLLRANFEPGFRNGRISILDWDKWVEIDADGDNGTGDANGNDIRARIDFKFNDIDMDLSITNPTELTIDGGVMFQFERLDGANASGSLPLEIHFMKSVSYTGSNFLWTLGFEFDDAPFAFNTTVTAEKISFSRPTIGQSITNLLDWFNQLMSDPQNATFNFSAMEIQGPYLIDLWMDTPVPSLYFALTYSKMEYDSLLERTWGEGTIAGPPGGGMAPTHFSLGLDSPTLDLPFDELEWKANGVSDLEVRFFEERDNTTYAIVRIPETPRGFFIDLDRPTGGSNVTKVRWQADDVIPLMTYMEFEYFEHDSNMFTSINVALYDLPTRMDIEGTFDVGSEEPPEAEWNSPPLMPVRMMDGLMLRFVSKLYRVARTIQSLPRNIVNMPDRDGYFKLNIPNDGQIGRIEFTISSDTSVVASAADDYLAFYNDTPKYEGTDYPYISNSLTGRLTGIKYMNGDFTEGTDINLVLEERRDLEVLFIDNPADARATVKLEDLPLDTRLKFLPDEISFVGSQEMTSLEYESLVGEQYFRLALERLPVELRMDQGSDTFSLDTIGGAIGVMEITVTNSHVREFPIDMNHVFLEHDGVNYLASGKLVEVNSIKYEQGVGGLMEAEFAVESPLYMYLRDDANMVLDQIYLDPFPSSLSMNLPGGLNSTGIRMPNVLDVASIFDFTPVMFQMDVLAQDIVGTLRDLTRNIANQIGSMGMNTTLDMFSTKPALLVASVEKGNMTDLHPVRWTHGVSVAIGEGGEAVQGRIYLTLPKVARLQSTSTDLDLDVNMTFEGFEPAYPFLDLEIWGMGDKDVSIYIAGLPTGQAFDLNIGVSLTADMTPGTGHIEAEFHHMATVELGQAWMNLWNKAGVPTITTIYLSSLPDQIDITAELSDHLWIDWTGNRGMDKAYIRSSRYVEDRWADIYAIVHDVPQALSARIESTDDYDMDGSPLQTLPIVTVDAITATMDIYVFQEGRAVGQPSIYEIHLKNIAKSFDTVFDGARYSIVSEGTDMVYIRVKDMPFYEDVDIIQLTIFGESVRGATLEVPMAFGAYPIIEIKDLDVEMMQINLKFRMSVFGNVRVADVALVDLRFRENLPLPMKVMFNGVHLTEGTDHVIVPAPMATLFRTILGV